MTRFSVTAAIRSDEAKQTIVVLTLATTALL